MNSSALSEPKDLKRANVRGNPWKLQSKTAVAVKANFEELLMVYVSSRTAEVAKDWKVNSYYDRAEQADWTSPFWRPETQFRRLFEKLNTRVTVDLACGHGRHTAQLLSIRTAQEPTTVYLLDVNQENVDYCKVRFAKTPDVEAYYNSGYDFAPVEDDTVTAILCYDAMVHFEYDAVLSYIRDAFRILAPGSRALLHHSNLEFGSGR